MTNSEAKEIIIKERDSLQANPIVKVEDCLYEAFDMAIKVLEQQPCEDCISRKAVRKLICQNNDKYGYSDRFHEFTERFLQLPSVKQQPKTGHWILYHPLQADDPGAYRCSVCGYGDWGLDPEIDKFCFNCGTRMTESEG